ncbi:S8 family serine peptidase [Spirosoma taeanense]|uniref:S8 family serine peptidase n=1 Tax=Spirosoma taeanense TaxID=2735870 RepID=A0A6M5Y5K0_9BACT|nr:S8 family serine peptidase [Spirosoma taeanense]QJW87962.1 S8 family serine peptidase [Spirosoma taeanense]
MQRHLQYLFSLAILLAANQLTAQPLPQYSAQQQARQGALLQTIQQYRSENYQQALTEALRQNRPISERRPDGNVLKLRGINNRGELLYDVTHSTTRAAQSTHTSALYAGGSLGLSLSGSTLKDKLAIWDGGKVFNTHVEFSNGNAGSRVTQVDNSSTLDLHATHVAGILMAAGVNTQVKGMAFGTNLRAYDFTNDDAEMGAAASNLLVSNHSYGAQSGWVYNDSRAGTVKWEWWGDTTVSATEDYKFGFYNSDARSWDDIAHNAPYYLIVKSAGNNHGENGPGPGQLHYVINRRVYSSATRNNQDGYDQISTYGTAKNILSVGAVSNLSSGYNQPSDVNLADFSSWGPTDDGRIKPDIVGVGVNVLSTSSDNANAYATLSGTSMASPNVAGSVLLLQELFAQRNNGRYLRSATLKGLVLHTADEAGNAPGPDYRNGWGILNDEKAGRVILNTDQSHLLDERTLNQGDKYTLPVIASGRGPLIVTICWTDPAATASVPSATTLNDRTPKLVNDLDIRVSDGSRTTLPWILDPNNPANPATRGDNIRDNVEQIVIDNPVPGRTYTLSISHKGTLSGNSQDYGLLISGIGGKAYCSSAATSTGGVKISRVQFGGIDQPGPADCSTAYVDFTQTVTTIQVGQQIPLTITPATCGTWKSAYLKAFADWNLDGDFDDANETVTTSNLLANPTPFISAVTVPASISNGQLIPLRIVLTEAANAGNVSACVSTGQTQDFLLKAVQTANDVGALALVSPEANFCGQTGSAITVAVRLRNYGTADQHNVPVTVRVTDVSNTEVASLTGTVATLLAFRESQLTLNTPTGINLAAGQTYRFTITTNLGSDQNGTNNTLTEIRTTAGAPTNGLFSATRCGSDTAISLRNTGGGTAFWYDAPTGGNLLAAGNQIALRSLPATGQFYAVLNEFSGTVGPVDKKVFGGGSYSGNFGPAPLISTLVPLTLESARLYIGTAGKLTFTVRKYDNAAVSSVTLDVTPTRNQSLTATSNGQLVDDPNDPGAVYALNLRIPQAGDYKITIEYDEGASIFRSNAGVTGFPYRLTTQTGQPVLSIKGSLFNNGTTTDTLRTAWYYFYNLKVRSLDCPGPQRTAVAPTAGTAATATITPDGSTSVCQGSSLTLRANTGTGLSYQWFRDGQTISGATSSTLSISTSGSYAVQVANSCLPVLSATVPVAVRTALTPLISVNNFTLTSNATSGVQWLLNGLPIAGAINPTYTVVQTGRYSVRGSVNGCGEAISEEVYLAILAAEPEPDDVLLTVYPNPTTRQLTISLSAPYSGQQLPMARFVDLRGLTVRTVMLQREGKSYSATVDVTDLPAGAFFVVVGDDQTQTVRVRRIHKQ